MSKDYRFEPYDVLQITYDNGNRWDDYCSLRTEDEGRQAKNRVDGTRTTIHQGGSSRVLLQQQRYRIKRNGRVVYGE